MGIVRKYIATETLYESITILEYLELAVLVDISKIKLLAGFPGTSSLISFMLLY